MTDSTSKMLIPAIVAALAELSSAGDIIVEIYERRDDPRAVQALALKALTSIEHIQMSLCLEPPFPDELSKPKR